MKCKNLWVLLVSAVTLLVTLQSVSAFGTITNVEVNGVPAKQGVSFESISGGRIPVFVVFKATANAENVRIEAWFTGNRKNGVDTERFDVINGTVYSRLLYLDAPMNLNDNLNEPRNIEISVASDQAGVADRKEIALTLQRVSYAIDILDVNMPYEVRAGGNLLVDVVLKNIGNHPADENFVKVIIPELQVSTRAFFGDMSPVDRSNPDKSNTVERRVVLKIPSDAKTGLYEVKVEASNVDSTDSTVKRVFVRGSEADTKLISLENNKKVETSEQAEYKLTLINKGDKIAIYNLDISAPKGLEVKGDPFVVVPAGTSKTVTIKASAAKEGDYDFSVKVYTEDGSVVSDNRYRATVVEKEEKSGSGSSSVGGITVNATVLLTVILAIIFVVLLVVLIVLLTRKPEKTEEYGESYY